MVQSKASKDDIKGDELLILREESGYGWRRRLRVVMFIVNGVPRAPVVETRIFREKDEHPHGRSVGMNYEEAKTLAERWSEVQALWVGK